MKNRKSGLHRLNPIMTLVILLSNLTPVWSFANDGKPVFSGGELRARFVDTYGTDNYYKISSQELHRLSTSNLVQDRLALEKLQNEGKGAIELIDLDPGTYYSLDSALELANADAEQTRQGEVDNDSVNTPQDSTEDSVADSENEDSNPEQRSPAQRDTGTSRTIQLSLEKFKNLIISPSDDTLLSIQDNGSNLIVSALNKKSNGQDLIAASYPGCKVSIRADQKEVGISAQLELSNGMTAEKCFEKLSQVKNTVIENDRCDLKNNSVGNYTGCQTLRLTPPLRVTDSEKLKQEIDFKFIVKSNLRKDSVESLGQKYSPHAMEALADAQKKADDVIAEANACTSNTEDTDESKINSILKEIAEISDGLSSLESEDERLAKLEDAKKKLVAAKNTRQESRAAADLAELEERVKSATPSELAVLIQEVEDFFEENHHFTSSDKKAIYTALLDSATEKADPESYERILSALNSREIVRAIGLPDSSSRKQSILNEWKSNAASDSDYENLLSTSDKYTPTLKGKRNTDFSVSVLDQWATQARSTGSQASQKALIQALDDFAMNRKHSSALSDANRLASEIFSNMALAAQSKSELADLEKSMKAWRVSHPTSNSSLDDVYQSIAKKYADQNNPETFDIAKAKTSIIAAKNLASSKEEKARYIADEKNLAAGAFQFQMDQIRQSGFRPSVGMQMQYQRLMSNLSQDVYINCSASVGMNADPMAMQLACNDAQNRMNIVQEAAYPGSTQRNVTSVMGPSSQSQIGQMSGGFGGAGAAGFQMGMGQQQIAPAMQQNGQVPPAQSNMNGVPNGMTPLFVNQDMYRMF